MKLDILSRIENSMTEIEFVNTHLRTVESLESVYADISIIWNLILHSSQLRAGKIYLVLRPIEDKAKDILYDPDDSMSRAAMSGRASNECYPKVSKIS